MFHLAADLAGAGKKVLTTTTTKIYNPSSIQSKTVIISHSIEKLLAKADAFIQKGNHITAAASLIKKENKLKGFTLKQIHDLERANLFDWIIVEADGAAQRSLKAPADHEPAIPGNTAIWIGVTGLDVIGKPLTETHVFRAPRASYLIGLPLGETITETHVGTLLIHPLGLLKGVPSKAHRFIFLNKADDQNALESGRRIAKQLQPFASGHLKNIIIGQAKDRLLIHDWFPLPEMP